MPHLALKRGQAHAQVELLWSAAPGIQLLAELLGGGPAVDPVRREGELGRGPAGARGLLPVRAACDLLVGGQRLVRLAIPGEQGGPVEGKHLVRECLQKRPQRVGLAAVCQDLGHGRQQRPAQRGRISQRQLPGCRHHSRPCRRIGSVGLEKRAPEGDFVGSRQPWIGEPGDCGRVASASQPVSQRTQGGDIEIRGTRRIVGLRRLQHRSRLGIEAERHHGLCGA